MRHVTFKSKLLEARLRKRLSYEKLGGLLGYDRRTVQAWEAGRNEPNLCTLVKLSLILEISIDELLK